MIFFQVGNIVWRILEYARGGFCTRTFTQEKINEINMEVLVSE
jgi:hypothetical protein